MFQTWPIEAVQSIGNEWLTAIFVGFTALGYRAVFVPLLIVAIFAWDLRRGFWWTQCILFTALVTVSVKSLVGSPRPFQVSEAVQMLDPLLRAGESRHHALGFPSGHASMAVVIWGGLATMVAGRRLAALAVAIGAAVVFSRIYLGVHFLGDVLGGLVIGAVGWLVFSRVLGGPVPRHAEPVTTAELGSWIRGELDGPMPRAWFWAGILLPCLLLAWVPLETLATWWGLHLGFHLAHSRPAFGGDSRSLTPAVRLSGTLGAFILFGGTAWALNQGMSGLSVPAVDAVSGFLPAFAMVYGGIGISRWVSGRAASPAA